MKKLLCMCVVVVMMLTSAFPTGVFAGTTSSAEPDYYLASEFNDASDLDNWSLNMDSCTASVSNGQLHVSLLSGIKYPNIITKNVTIPSEESFVVEFKVDAYSRYSSIELAVYHPSVKALYTTGQGSEAVGTHLVIVDRQKGIFCYKDDQFVNSSATIAGEISSIKFYLQNYGESTNKFDYVRIYPITNDFEIINNEKTELDYVDIKFNPLMTGINLLGKVSVSDAEITRYEEISAGIYRLYFQEPLSADTPYSVTVDDVSYKDGLVISGQKSFTTRALRKGIDVTLKDTDFSGCVGNDFSVTKKLVASAVNEVDSSGTASVIAALYSASDGAMTALNHYDLSFETKNTELDFVLSDGNFNGDMLLELYAVDSLASMNRIGSKSLYNVSASSCEYELVEMPQISSSAVPQVTLKKDFDKGVLKVSLGSSNADGTEATLVVSEGYLDINQPAQLSGVSGIYYLKQVVIDDGTAEFTVKMPNRQAYYDIYIKTPGNDDFKIEGELFYTAENVRVAFEAMNSAKATAALPGEKTFIETVRNEGTLFGVNEFSDKICSIALALRDEQGGFKNYNNIAEVFELAQKITTRCDGDISAFIEYINNISPLNSLTLQTYKTKLDEKTLSAIHDDIKNADLNTLGDINEKFNLSIVTNGIAKAEHYSTVEYILEKLGEPVIGLSLEGYSKCDKSSVNKKLVGIKFESFSELETKFDNLVSEYSSVRKPSGGNGGISSGSIANITFDDQAFNHTEEGEAKNIFSDISDVAWAHEAISQLYKKGIICGKSEGLFDPHSNITRAEVAKMICLAFELDMQGEISYQDIESKDWHAAFVNAVTRAGIMNGVSESSFSPNSDITREMLATVLARAAELKGKKPASGNANFTDISDASDYSIESILALKNAGIVNGRENNMFKPKDFCSRAEATKMIFALIEFIQ